MTPTANPSLVCFRCGRWPCGCLDGLTLIHGDCLDALRALPARSVQCCISSPPYFQLRSYLPNDDPLKAKEIGSEPTPEAFLATMVAVFREVRRVLRDDGTLFVNLGDSYGTVDGQLQNMPHRVAEALRADGWLWRQTIVWAKRSPMPESVNGWRWVRCCVKVDKADDPLTGYGSSGNKRAVDHSLDIRNSARARWADCPGCDKCRRHGGFVLRQGSGRCTTAHEYVFVFAKSSGYFWDSEASKEAATSTSGGACVGKAGLADSTDKARGHLQRKMSAEENAAIRSGSRNPRSVWTLSSEPTSERHFATFPSELVRRCLVAGMSAGGCCPTCGAPWAPVLETEKVATRPGLAQKVKVPSGWDVAPGSHGTIHRDGRTEATYTDLTWKHADGDELGQRSAASPSLDPERHILLSTCKGYRPTCDCPAHEPIGCVVLDPFNGIGTTGQTARQLGCRYVGVDLNRHYLDVAARRILEPPRWWIRKQQARPKKKRARHPKQRELF